MTGRRFSSGCDGLYGAALPAGDRVYAPQARRRVHTACDAIRSRRIGRRTLKYACAPELSRALS